MEKISAKKLNELNFVCNTRGRKRKESPFYKIVSSLKVDEGVMMEESKVLEEAGINISSCRAVIFSKKRKDADSNMKGKKFSSSTGILDGKKMFFVKRIK